MDNPSKRVVEQRIRNRMIEYWETVSSFAEQEEYQKQVPYISVPNEMINQWEDWQPYENPADHYGQPVFSAEEVAAIEGYHRVWSDVADATPDPLSPLECLYGNRHWQRLSTGAAKALEIFLRRGKMDEEIEITEQDAPVDAK